MLDTLGNSPVADCDVPVVALSHDGNRAAVKKPACLHCQGHENLMHNGLCRDCDSVELIRDAWADEIAAILSCG